MNKICLIFQQLSPEKTDASKTQTLSSRSTRRRSCGSGRESRCSAASGLVSPRCPSRSRRRCPRQATPRREQQRCESWLCSLGAGRESQNQHAPRAQPATFFHTTRTDHALTLCQARCQAQGTWRLGHGPRLRQGLRTAQWLSTRPWHSLPALQGHFFSSATIIKEAATGI